MNIKSLIALPISAVLLISCNTVPKDHIKPDLEPPELPAVIYVPVIQEWPEPPAAVRPDLPYNRLTPEEKSDPSVLNRALVSTVEVLVSYATQLELALDAYRHKSDD